MKDAAYFQQYSPTVANFFDPFQKTTDSAKRMGWSNRESQHSRFHQLSSISAFFEHSILDIGCGIGGLYEHMQSKDLDVKYTGIDIRKDFIEQATKSFATHTSSHPEFIHADFLDPDFQTEYDYIFASGTFNHRIPNQMQYIEACIKKMIKLSRYAVGFNLLSDTTPYHMKEAHSLFYYNAPKILAICLAYCPYVVIKQHYLPNDMTLYIYKEPIGKYDEDTVVYTPSNQT